MIKRCISQGWLYKGEDQGYVEVDLPHDYAIGKKRSPDCNGSGSNAYCPDGSGRYVKHLTLTEKKHYVLDIDGAYMRTRVYLNENYLTMHPHGYTPLLVDLTDAVMTDCTNKLVITTDPLPDSTRWYSGNGLYRDVFLWEGGDVRIEPWDMFISTVDIDRALARIRLSYTVTADKSADVTVQFTVKDADGACVLTEQMALSVNEGKNSFERIVTLMNPRLWDLEDPHLYTLKTVLLEGDALLDLSSNTFGVRTIAANVKDGLLLNGKTIKLRGGCIHHDHGVLGAAAFPAAEERKLRLLKEAGFNAIRTAHNPPSLALLECCDRMGIVVMDEAFDVWNKAKKANDYHWYFEDWCQRDLSYMILRERNHPCVFSYSIGNEIFEIDGTSRSGEWSKLLVDVAKRLDDTRFVTSGIQKCFSRSVYAEDIDPEDYREYVRSKHNDIDDVAVNRLAAEYEKPLDIVGQNYYYDRYHLDHAMYPDRVIWGSETKALEFYDSWQQVKDNSYIIGDFTWTAFDNLGEVGAGRGMWERDGVLTGISLFDYPCRCCYQGDLDLCGYRRPQSYFREAVWLGNVEPRIFVTHPMHYGESYSGSGWHWYDVHETWTFDDSYVGKPVKVETYTDAERIEWYVNGEKVGESIPKKCIATIDTVYRKGEITAVAYKRGAECSRYTLTTTDEAKKIHVRPERSDFAADGRDLCYLNITITDDSGRWVDSYTGELSCKVDGGELLGIFSGDPCNDDQYTSNRCHAFNGQAVAIIRTKTPGDVRVHVQSAPLTPGSVTVEAK